MTGILSRAASTLSGAVRHCRTCRHAEKMTSDQFRARLTLRSPTLGEQSVADHPAIKGALDSGKTFVFCREHKMFTEADDCCELHSLIGLRTTARRILYGDAPHPRPTPPAGIPDPGPSQKPPPPTDFERGLCFACGLEMSRCKGCQMPRGICAQCECGREVRYSRAEKRWWCTACERRGAGYHPSMPLKWPDGYCDGCRESLAAKQQKADTPDINAFGGSPF